MLPPAALDVFIHTSHILRRVSLEVGVREVVCLVGRNGSGKTTTLRTIMGLLRPAAGRVEFRGEPIHGRRTHEIARLGLGWAPEDSGLFPDLTVAENILGGPPDDAWRHATVTRIIGGAPRPTPPSRSPLQ